MTAALLPNGKQTFYDYNGVPLVDGKVYFYIPNTDTLKNTWQNAQQTILNTNPVVLDELGSAVIYGQGTYRQVLQDSLGNEIWDQLTQGSAASNTYINVQTTFGAVGDGVADDTVAIQAGLDYIEANGGKLYFPSGKYRITAALSVTFDFTTSTSITRPSIIGDSAGNAQILWDGANTPTIYMLTIQRTDSADGNGLHAHSIIEGISFAPINSGKIGYANGLTLIKWAYINVNNIWCHSLNTGLKLEQVISSTFTDVKCLFNNFGLYSLGSPTSAISDVYANNANTFIGCSIGANNTAGMRMIDGSFTMLGGSVEGNGTNASAGAGYGAWINNTATGSPVACNFNGVYFEGNGTTGNSGANAGIADVVILHNNTTDNNSYNFQACNFNRLAANYAPYAIVLQKVSNTAAGLSVTGCDFTDYGGYSPSASRPYIKLSNDGGSMTNINLDVTGNYYNQATEEPDFILGTAYYAGSVAGFERNKSYTSLVYNSAGNQSITSGTPTALTWDTTVSNDAVIWVGGSPTRLTVPAGVTRVRLAGNIRIEATNIVGTFQYELFMFKNGTNFIGMPFQHTVVTTSNFIRALNVSSGIITVTGGDYFELMTLQGSGSTIHTDSGSAGAIDPTWFSMEIIE